MKKNRKFLSTAIALAIAGSVNLSLNSPVLANDIGTEQTYEATIIKNYTDNGNPLYQLSFTNKLPGGLSPIIYIDGDHPLLQQVAGKQDIPVEIKDGQIVIKLGDSEEQSLSFNEDQFKNNINGDYKVTGKDSVESFVPPKFSSTPPSTEPLPQPPGENGQISPQPPAVDQEHPESDGGQGAVEKPEDDSSSEDNKLPGDTVVNPDGESSGSNEDNQQEDGEPPVVIPPVTSPEDGHTEEVPPSEEQNQAPPVGSPDEEHQTPPVVQPDEEHPAPPPVPEPEPEEENHDTVLPPNTEGQDQVQPPESVVPEEPESQGDNQDQHPGVQEPDSQPNEDEDADNDDVPKPEKGLNSDEQRLLKSMMDATVTSWLAEQNDVHKRLGELHYADGNSGIWARTYGGKYDNKDNGYSGKYKAIQVGYDTKVKNSPWLVGLAGSMVKTDDAALAFGKTDTTLKGLTIYGTMQGKNNDYLDLVTKFSTVRNDYTIGDGDLSVKNKTKGFSFSAEYGRKFQKENGFYVEPQVELRYGHLGNSHVDLPGNPSLLDFNSLNIFTTRLGVNVGKQLAHGHIYSGISVNHNFGGKSTTYAISGKEKYGVTSNYNGTWYTVNVGATYKIGLASNMYANIEKSFGGKMKANYRYDLGFRFNF